MFKLLLPVLAAATLVATPAVAQTNANFTGPRVELDAGVNDLRNTYHGFNDVTYSAAAGLDGPLGDRFTLGAEVAAENVFDKNGRTIGAGARLGYALSPTVLAYGRVGYTHVDLNDQLNLNGLNAGAGLNVALSRNFYGNLEYRYTDFERNIGSHGARVGVGLRF